MCTLSTDKKLDWLSYAILGGNSKDELVVDGYMKNVSKELDILIPTELIAIFGRFYISDTMVYLFQRGDFSCINLYDILECVSFD